MFPVPHGGGKSQGATVTVSEALELLETTVNTKFLAICNDGLNPVYLGFGDAATTAGTGLCIPAGGRWEASCINMPVCKIYAVAKTGESHVCWVAA